MARNVRCTVAWVAAGALSVAGVVTLALGLATPVSFGWFAYQPARAVAIPPGRSAPAQAAGSRAFSKGCTRNPGSTSMMSSTVYPLVAYRACASGWRGPVVSKTRV